MRTKAALVAGTLVGAVAGLVVLFLGYGGGSGSSPAGRGAPPAKRNDTGTKAPFDPTLASAAGGKTRPGGTAAGGAGAAAPASVGAKGRAGDGSNAPGAAPQPPGPGGTQPVLVRPPVAPTLPGGGAAGASGAAPGTQAPAASGEKTPKGAIPTSPVDRLVGGFAAGLDTRHTVPLASPKGVTGTAGPLRGLKPKSSETK